MTAETSYQMYVRRFIVLLSGQGLNSFIKSNLFFLMKGKKEKKLSLPEEQPTFGDATTGFSTK